MTTAPDTTQVRRTPARRSSNGSFVSPFLRHLLMLAAVAAITYVFVGAVTVGEQLTVWLAAGVALGIVAALVGRRWFGLLFLVAGAFIGLLVHLHVRLGSGEEAIHELSQHAAQYGLTTAAAVVGYLTGILVLRLFRGRDPRRSPSRD